ncbi:MAG: dihydrofolate reductase [Cytophagaceae bacterium]|jgi:dihydrofolate reductase|nr:dihydrofolate reductase [Cytophagaceae bacterium]
MSTTISLIAVVDTNFGIGRAGDQLAYISNDLKRFKRLTSGKPVVMGRKTFEALPKGALPNRRNIILTRNSALNYPNTEIAVSVEEALQLLQNEEEIFVIGGGEVYRLFLPCANRLYLTHINHSFDNVDTFFPKFDQSKWETTSREGVFTDDKSGLSYFFEDMVLKTEE